MSQRAFSLASLVANHVNSCRDRKAEKIRKQRRFLKTAPLDLLEKRQLLTSYIVTSNADTGTGTLRNIIALAQANSSVPHSISFNTTAGGAFATANTITVNSPITLSGSNLANLRINGFDMVTISGGNQTGIFNIQSNTSLLSLSIKYGNGANLPSGGAIYNNQANLTLNDVILANNTASWGGAVYNNGSGSILTILNSSLSYNNATTGSGGAIYNKGTSGNVTLNITNSTLSYNKASTNGGAVYNDGASGNATMTITNSTLSYNNASTNGGAIYNQGTSGKALLNITNSTLSYNNATNYGGAVYNNGNSGNATMTITNSTLAYNKATNSGGAVYNYSNSGNTTLSIANSTLSNNNATDSGGAIYNQGSAGNTTLSIANSTLSYNNASTNGGAIYSDGYSGNATLNIANSTLSNNNATDSGGAVYSNGTSGNATLNVNQTTIAFNNAATGGGLYDYNNVGHLYLYNSIVSNNTATTGPDVSGTLAVANYTLFSDVSGTTITSGTGNIVGNPMLGTLGSYGGPTQTIALLSGSDAIAKVNGLFANATTDQRGYTPPSSVTANADMGAFQSGGQLDGTVTVNATGETAVLGQMTLRQAITLANQWAGNATTVNFAGSLTATGNATIELQNVTTGYGPITINAPGSTTTISGPTTGNTVTISGGNVTGIFNVNSPTTINNLSIKYGNGNGMPPLPYMSSGTPGGAIYNNRTNLTLESITLACNTARDGSPYENGLGGAVFINGNGNATVNISNSILSENDADWGGAIDCFSNTTNSNVILNITNSTLSNNTGIEGGAIELYNEGGNQTVTITNSTLSYNNANGYGGAISIESWDQRVNPLTGITSLTITNSNISYNEAYNQGGAISNQAEYNKTNTVTITNSNLSYNNVTHFSYSYGGGAVYNWLVSANSTMTISNSTLSYNNGGGGGGAVFDENYGNGTVNITDSILANNNAAEGGAVYIRYDGLVNINNSTLTNSTATTGASASVRGGSLLLTNTTTANSIYVYLLGNLTIDGGSFVNPLSIDNGNIITVTNYAGNVSFGYVTAKTLNVNLPSGNISQVSGTRIIVSGNTSLNVPGNTITLDQATNNFYRTGNISACGTVISIRNGNGTNLGAISATGLTVNSTGCITQVSGTGIVVTGNTSLTTTGNAITLNSLTNDFISTGNITVTGAAVTIYNSNATQLGTVSATDFTVNSTGGNITQVSGTNITASGNTSLIATGNEITVTEPNNNFYSTGSISACGTNIAIINSNATRLGLVAGSNLTVNSTGGAITQAPGTNVTVSGSSNFISPANITLDSTTNDFNTVTASGTNITITDINALTLDTITGNGILRFTASDLQIISTVNATLPGSAYLIPTSGTVVDLGTNSAGNFGLIQTELNNITAGSLTIGGSTSGPFIMTDTISRTNATLGTNLTLISGNTITQTGPSNLVIAGTANFISYGSGTSGNITLNNATNNFYSSGCITACGTNITIINSNATRLAAISASDFTVNSTGGGISQVSGTGIVTAGNTCLTATGNAITLDSPTNDFIGTGTITATGGAISIRNANTTQFGNVSASSFTVNSTGGAITQVSGGIVSTGSTSLTATGNTITLDSSTNDFIGTGTITATGGAISIRNSNATQFGNVSASSFTVNSTGGNITQATGTNITATGTANFISSGNITLNNTTNNFSTVTANASVISIQDSNNITLLAITAPGGLSVSTNQTLGCISVTGPIDTTGGSGGVTLTGRNLQVIGNITTAAGDIAIYGNGGGSYQTGPFMGVNISNSVSTTVNITSSSGNITIDGRGGLGSGAYGVSITRAVISTGNNGALSITGLSGNGAATSAHGLYLNDVPTNLLTVNGSISLTGTSNSTGNSSDGVRFNNVGAVKASGSGSISVTGYSGLSGSDQDGIWFYRNPPSSNTVESTSGNITFNGISRGSSNTCEGINLVLYPGIYASNGGSIFFDATTANASALAIELYDQGNARGPSIVASNGGSISFTADSFGITGNAIISAGLSGNVNFNSKGAVIDLGGADTTSNLGLSNTEIGKITANVLVIGNNTASAIVSTGPLSRTNATLGTNLTVISGSSITQTGGNLTVAGTANFVSAGTGTSGNITLNNTTNNFYTGGCITACGTNVTITNSNATQLGAISASNFGVNSTGGAITQVSGTGLTVTGNTVLTATGNAITILALTNNFYSTGSIAATGNVIEIQNSNATTFGNVRASNLTVNSTGGNITQVSGTNIVVSGTANFVTTGALILNNDTNSIGNVSSSAVDVYVNATSSQEFTNITTNNLTLTGTGSFTQSPGSNITTSGTLTISTTGNVTFTNTTNSFAGQISLNGNVVSVYNSISSNLGLITANDLSFTASSGNIIQSNQIVVRNTNTTYLTAISGNIILNNTTNDFVGGIYANASNNIELYNSNATKLGNISSANFQLVSAGGNISQVSGTGVSVSGTSNLVALGNSIILTEPTNAFGTLTANATNLKLADSNNMFLANTSISNTVNITQANQITTSGSYVAPTTLLNNGTFTVASQIQTNLTVNNGTANVQTSGNITGNAILNGGSLISNGTFATLTLNGGTLYTSHNGTLVNGALTFNNGSNWSPSGSNLTDFGTISTPGPVTIQPNANLTAIAPGGMVYGDGLTLMNQTGSTAISQANGYYGLPNGTLFTSNNTSLQIYYNGQSGNFTKASSGNDLIVRVATGNISVITPSPTTNANQAFSGNLTFRVMGGTGNTVGVANVPVTVVLPADVDNCNIASGRFDYSNFNNRSVTRYTDSNGNITIPTWANYNPGPFQACLTQSDEPTVYTKPYMGVVGLAVQRQSVNRSFVRYLDVVLSGSDLANITTPAMFASNFTLTKTKTASYTGGADIPSPGNITFSSNITTTPVGFTIDFGAQGLGGAPTSTDPDGAYQLANTTTLSANATYTFHRLLGDANGDMVVDALDTSLVQSVQLARAWRYNNAANLTWPSDNNPVATSAWAGDLNGDGRVNALDLNISGRWRGRRVIYNRVVT